MKVIPSLHSALNGKHFFDSRVVPRDFQGPRRHGTDVEGGTLAYLLRLASYEILWFGSMNYIEREVAGLRPDVAMIAAARQRLEIYDYTGRLMRALGNPRIVFATHGTNSRSHSARPRTSTCARPRCSCGRSRPPHRARG